MSRKKRVGSEADIERAFDISSLAYSSATLVDTKGAPIDRAELCFAYLKLYQQTPHEGPGQLKPQDPCRFIEMSAMPPAEWYDFVEEPMLTSQHQGAQSLWVYDPEWQPRRFEDYLTHFYRKLYPDGYALDISPMGLFQIDRESNALARCFQLDLEASPQRWPSVVLEMQNRVKNPNDLNGMMIESSQSGTHFHGHSYFYLEPVGKLQLVNLYGHALLINREGQPKNVDERSVGHVLRSLEEEWSPLARKTEVGCLRITPSLLKESQPEFISFTPI